MIELRKRDSFNRNMKYNKVNTEDDIDAVPTLNTYSFNENKQKEPKKSRKLHICAKVCGVFSLTAIIFLSILAFLFQSNTPYIKISGPYENNKPALVEGIVGAIIIYFGIFGFCTYLWFRSQSVGNSDDVQLQMRLLD